MKDHNEEELKFIMKQGKISLISMLIVIGLLALILLFK